MSEEKRVWTTEAILEESRETLINLLHDKLPSDLTLYPKILNGLHKKGLVEALPDDLETSYPDLTEKGTKKALSLLEERWSRGDVNWNLFPESIFTLPLVRTFYADVIARLVWLNQQPDAGLPIHLSRVGAYADLEKIKQFRLNLEVPDTFLNPGWLLDMSKPNSVGIPSIFTRYELLAHNKMPERPLRELFLDTHTTIREWSLKRLLWLKSIWSWAGDRSEFLILEGRIDEDDDVKIDHPKYVGATLVNEGRDFSEARSDLEDIFNDLESTGDNHPTTRYRHLRW